MHDSVVLVNVLVAVSFLVCIMVLKNLSSLSLLEEQSDSHEMINFALGCDLTIIDNCPYFDTVYSAN